MKRIINSPFFSLIRRDFLVRYVGSYMGIMWAFVQPVVTVGIFWVVFSIGLKVRPVSDVPFIVWLLPGYLAWQYFAEAVSSGTGSIVESSYLVKKIAFRVEELPVVKMMTALVVHIFFVVIMVIVYKAAGQEIRAGSLQLAYYLGAMMSLVYGLSMLTSALSVFVRDVGQVVGIVLQIGFWGTPIFWGAEILPEEYRWIIGINPMAYIVEGYRQSMIGGLWFWERPETVNYWVVTVMIVIIGRRVFRRMRPHFADVI